MLVLVLQPALNNIKDRVSTTVEKQCCQNTQFTGGLRGYTALLFALQSNADIACLSSQVLLVACPHPLCHNTIKLSAPVFVNAKGRCVFHFQVEMRVGPREPSL